MGYSKHMLYSPSQSLGQVSRVIGIALLQHGWQITCAESCTGGAVSAAITDVPGSSAYFSYGFVTYSNMAKQTLLGVRAATLAAWGAVSEQTAQEMAQGARRLAGADIAVAITGIAGPTCGTSEKPVGVVCFAWATDNATVISQLRQFGGDRAAVRRQAAYHALRFLYDHFLTSS